MGRILSPALSWSGAYLCLLWLVLPPIGLSANSSPGEVYVSDSDYLFLDVRPTSLPHAVGNGVFAKRDIPAGEILCELRGLVIDGDAPYVSDKLHSIILQEDGGVHRYSIIVSSLCSSLNDAVNILGKEYTREELHELTHNDSTKIPTYPGYSYNARYQNTFLGKVFIISTNNISVNSEIYFDYDK